MRYYQFLCLIPKFPIFSIGSFLTGKQPGILFIQILYLWNLLHAQIIECLLGRLILLKRKDARQKSFLLNVSKRIKKDTNVQIPSESVKRSCVSEI